MPPSQPRATVPSDDGTPENIPFLTSSDRDTQDEHLGKARRKYTPKTITNADPCGKGDRAGGTERGRAKDGEVEPLCCERTATGLRLDYPLWFFDTAVTLREELQAPQSLVLSGQTSGVKLNRAAGPKYILDRDAYEQALDIISSLTKVPDNHGSKNQAGSWSDSGAFLLQSPSHDSLDFLNTVVHRLAKDVDADVVDLGQGPMEDILHYWIHGLNDTGQKLFPSAAEYFKTEKGFPTNSHFKRTFSENNLHLDDRKYMVDRLLTARSWKRHEQGHNYKPRTLIVLLPDVTAYTVRYSWVQPEFLELLYSEVKRRRQHGGTPTLIIGTAPSSRTHDEYFPQSDMGREGISHVHSKLNLDPSLVLDISPRRSWSLAGPRLPCRAVNRVDWWSRLRVSLAHELHQVGETDFPGVEMLRPGARPPQPEIDAFFNHPAWTGDMTIKVFRQIVACARRQGRLDAREVHAVVARVGKNDAPLQFGGWEEVPLHCVIVACNFVRDIPLEFWGCLVGFGGLWLFLYYSMLLLF